MLANSAKLFRPLNKITLRYVASSPNSHIPTVQPANAKSPNFTSASYAPNNMRTNEHDRPTNENKPGYRDAPDTMKKINKQIKAGLEPDNQPDTAGYALGGNVKFEGGAEHIKSNAQHNEKINRPKPSPSGTGSKPVDAGAKTGYGTFC